MGKERIPNYELLRILAMLFIVMGHMSHGNKTLLNYFFVPQHVDCFILISGFFLVTAKFRSIGFWKTLFETVFYSGGITLMMYFITGNVGIFDILKSFDPLAQTRYSYWFVSNYLGLLIFWPFLSKIAASLTKRQYELMLLALTVTCTTFIYAFFPLGYCSGWTLWWFICLFFFGGYLRLHTNKFHFSHWGKLLILLMILYWGTTRWVTIITHDYNSLHVLAIAICTFMWIKGLKLNRGRQIIYYISPHVFAIYLIHCQILLYPYLLEQMKNYGLQSDNILVGTGYLITITIVVFIFSIIIDKFRIILFKVTHVDALINYVASSTDNILYNYISNKKYNYF